MVEVIKITYDSPELKEAFRIREEVFLVEQEVDPAIEYEFEEESHHFLALVNGQAAGTARWRSTPKGIKLERFAVKKEYRKQGVASLLITFILNDIAKHHSKPHIYLHAQEAVLDLYAKQGFVAIGDRFWEADIPHFKMVLE